MAKRAVAERRTVRGHRARGGPPRRRRDRHPPRPAGARPVAACARPPRGSGQGQRPGVGLRIPRRRDDRPPSTPSSRPRPRPPDATRGRSSPRRTPRRGRPRGGTRRPAGAPARAPSRRSAPGRRRSGTPSASGPRNARASSSSPATTQSTRTSAPVKLRRIRAAVSRIQALSLVYGSRTTTTRWKVVSHCSRVRPSPWIGVEVSSRDGSLATAGDGSGSGREAASPPGRVASLGAPDRAAAVRGPGVGRGPGPRRAGDGRCAGRARARSGRAGHGLPPHRRPPPDLRPALVAVRAGC